LIEFLEHLAAAWAADANSSAVQDPEGVYNTLIQQYLTCAEEATGVGGEGGEGAGVGGEAAKMAKMYHKKTLALLKDPRARYDGDAAMVLCEVHGFVSGAVYLLERKGLYRCVKPYTLHPTPYTLHPTLEIRRGLPAGAQGAVSVRVRVVVLGWCCRGAIVLPGC